MKQLPSFRRLAAAPVICASLALASMSHGQSCAYPHGADPARGPTSTLPFGGASPRSHYLQFLVPKTALGNVRREIRALGFAPASRVLGDFKVTIRHSTLTSLSTDRLKNISGFTSTAQFGAVRWAVRADSWNRVPVSYPYDPAKGGLLIEVFCKSASAQGAGDLGFRQAPGVQALYSGGWGFQPPRLGQLVQGVPKLELCFDAPLFMTLEDSSCAGSNQKPPRLDFAGSPRLGASFDVRLADAAGSSGLAVLIWGFRHLSGDGLDLTPAGAPGCVLRLRIDFVFGFATTQGRATARIPVPNDARLVGVDPLGFQWFPFDASANRLQFVSSNWGFARLGS